MATAPKMVAVGSPEFNEAVAAAVANCLGSAGSMPGPVSGQALPQAVQPTSIDLTRPGMDDLTVRFHRFCTFQECGYQKGQEAGFPRKAAETLERSGAATIVHDPRRHR